MTSTIINHKYENNELSFEVDFDGKQKWVKSDDLNEEDNEMIQKYWSDFSKKTNDDNISAWGLTQLAIPPPTKILNVINIDDVPHALCEFDTFDTPVYVKTRILMNAFPAILTNFYEEHILQNPNKYSKSD
ncbi:hypothetical protein M9Y10_028677 [Tritrichomonas musculus]|uniref:Uncharacterized protein n=1 Tax=Tritrichomonas musculus TaxID=1915356 RepID=A0ABR2KKZ5_9EUKA